MLALATKCGMGAFMNHRLREYGPIGILLALMAWLVVAAGNRRHRRLKRLLALLTPERLGHDSVIRFRPILRMDGRSRAS